MLLIAVIMAVALATLVSCRSSDLPANDADLIAVLCRDPSCVQIISLTDLKVVDTIPLRSLSLRFALNTATGLIYTAQCGGVSIDADRVVGEIDARAGKLIRYIDLEYPNPSDIVVWDNKAYVIHGFMKGTPRQFVGSKIDLHDYSVEEFQLPAVPSGLHLREGTAYTQITPLDDSLERYLLSYDLSTNKGIRLEFEEGYSFSQIAFDQNGLGYGLVGRRSSGQEGYGLVVFDPKDGSTIRTLDLDDVEDLGGRPRRILWHDGHLFVSSGGPNNAQGGNSIGVVNVETGKVEHVLRDVDEPSGMIAIGDLLFVGEYSDKTLAVVDLSTYRVVETIPLSGSPYDLLCLNQDR